MVEIICRKKGCIYSKPIIEDEKMCCCTKDVIIIGQFGDCLSCSQMENELDELEKQVDTLSKNVEKWKKSSDTLVKNIKKAKK